MTQTDQTQVLEFDLDLRVSEHTPLEVQARELGLRLAISTYKVTLVTVEYKSSLFYASLDILKLSILVQAAILWGKVVLVPPFSSGV